MDVDEKLDLKTAQVMAPEPQKDSRARKEDLFRPIVDSFFEGLEITNHKIND